MILGGASSNADLSELAWAAGLIEAEGCFYVEKKKTARGIPYRGFRIQVKTLDRDVTERLEAAAGGALGKSHPPGRAHFDPMWTWTLRRKGGSVEFARSIRPLMSSRRQEQIDHFLGIAADFPVQYERPTLFAAILDDTHDLNWLSGVMEGDGSFHLATTIYGKKHAVVQLMMSDGDTVRRAQEVAGVGHLHGPYHYSYRPKSVFKWAVAAAAESRPLAMRLRPLMCERRQRQIDALLAN